MTVFILVAVGIWGFALVVIVVACWLEPDESGAHDFEQATWEIHVAEAIRIARGDLDTRINTIRAQIHRNHDAEVERLRAELDNWGKPA